MKIDDLFWIGPESAKDRNIGLGASEASSLLGTNKWSTPQDLLDTKLGRKHFAGNRLTMWGTVLEHHVVDIEYRPPFEAEVFCPVTRANTGIISSHVCEHKTNKLLRCSPDRFLIDEEENILCGLEIKTSWAYKQEWLLAAYTPQLQWSMLVTGLPKWELFCSWQSKRPDAGNRNSRHMVTADPIMQAELLDRAEKFWRFVEEKADKLPEDWYE